MDLAVLGLCALSCGVATEIEPAVPSISAPNTVLFDNVTEQSGTAHTYTYPPEIVGVIQNLGGGAVAEDLDNDGDIDLLVANGGGAKALFWNRGDGIFDEGAEAAGVAFPNDFTQGVGAADLDNDGDQDLYYVNHAADRVLLNQGDRTFVDVTSGCGANLPTPAHGIQFGDINNDGILDFFVGDTVADGGAVAPPTAADILKWELSPSHVFVGKPGVVYEDISATVTPGGVSKGNPFLGALLDLDGDADTDLFLIQDAQQRVLNVLYENLGPDSDGVARLRNVSKTCGCEAPFAGMGLAVLDIDNNGLPDLYITNVYDQWPNREALLFNQGGLVFADVTDALNAAPMDPFVETGVRSVSWAAVGLDVENDTVEDIFVVYGELVWDELPPDSKVFPQIKPNQPDALLRAQFDGRYIVAEGSGVEDTGRGHAAVVADFNGDGCQDIYVVNLGTPSNMYQNRCVGAGHYIDIQLEGTRSNRDAIAARVKIQAGPRTQWHQVVGCSTSVHSCLPKRLHFGLGPFERVDSVEIHWPAGGVQTVKNLAADQLHRIKEP